MAGDKDLPGTGQDEEFEIEVAEDEAADGTVEHENGDVTVDLDDVEPGTDVQEAPEFYANLAESLPETVISAIGTKLVELTDEDKIAHDGRIQAYADALKRTGMDGNPSGGADFEGASKAVLPVLQEAAVDFASSAIRELFPIGGQDGGPVKQQIIGKLTQPKMDKAERKSKHMNWQLTKQMPTFRDDLEELLTQNALAGRYYMKFYWDKKRKRPAHMPVPMDDIWLPSNYSSFESVDRFTHLQPLSGLQFQERVDSGMYRAIVLGSPSEPEQTAAQDAADSLAGKTRDGQNRDDNRKVREIYCWLEIAEDAATGGELAPYIVSINDEGHEVLAIYRNWDIDDEEREELRHIVEFPFVPWRGGPVGLPQLIGGLGIAGTGALRAMLDAAHISNQQGLVKLKGGGADKGKNVVLSPGTMTEIDSKANVDDIRKAVMPIPTNPPSTVLFQLLGFVNETAKGVVNVALEKLADNASDMPVGTTLALIEQGSKVYAAIHSRLHRSMERCLSVLHQLNRLYLDEETLIKEAGDLLAKRADYDGAMDVCPVSDPNIFTETQRYAQTQAIAQRAGGNPLYDQYEVEMRVLKQLRIPDPESLLVKRPEPKRLNPVNENMAMAMGQPVVAFPDQDHAAHLMDHLAFWQSPMFGQNPIIQPTLAPALVQHLKEHMLYFYVQSVVESSEAVLEYSTGKRVDITKLMDDDDEVSKQMDQLVSEMSGVFLEEAEEAFDRLMPVAPPPPMPGAEPPKPSQMLGLLNQMMQLVQSLQPPQPMDPSMVQSKEVDRKAAADQAKTQGEAEDRAIKRMELQQQASTEERKMLDAQNERMEETRLAEREMEKDVHVATVNNQSDERMNVQDNITALTIADAEMQSGERVALSTGTGINPNPSE